MELRNFPNCCTAKIIVNFGESATNGLEPFEQTKPSKAEIKKYLKDCEVRLSNLAFLSAVTTDEQITANQVLEEEGWLSSEWLEKKQHVNTKVKLWWKPLYEKTE